MVLMEQKYNITELKDRYQRGETLKYIFFWGHTPSKDRLTKTCFSQWYECTFIVDGMEYKTAEQYMMAQKALLFKDMKIFEQIMAASHPREYKALGRKISNFKESVWNQNKVQIVIQGNLAKFGQNKEFKEFLLQTGSRILVEASPYDKIWGIGLSADTPNLENPNIWKGENLLGFALMEVREQLQKEG